MAFPPAGGGLLDALTGTGTLTTGNFSNDPLHFGGGLTRTATGAQANSGGYGGAWWNLTTFGPGLFLYLTLNARPANGSGNGMWIDAFQQPSATVATADGYQAELLINATDSVRLWKYTNAVNTSMVASLNLPANFVAGSDALGLEILTDGHVNLHTFQSGIWTQRLSVTDTGTTYFGVPLSVGFELFDSARVARATNFTAGTISTTSVVGASLVQPAKVLAFRNASLVQPATLLSGLTTVGASLIQPSGVIARVGGSLIQKSTIGTITVGGSLLQRSLVYRTMVQVGPGNNDTSARGVVRTSGGRVYIFVHDDRTNIGVIHAYKSGQTGHAITSFSEVDSTHRPVSAGASVTQVLSCPTCVLDPATGVVHMVYHDNSSGQANCTVYYQTFDTTTDLWGARETIATGAYGTQAVNGFTRATSSQGLALGPAGELTAVYSASTTTVAAKTRTGPGTWSSATNIHTGSTNPIHEMLAVDYAGDLHLCWFSQESNRSFRYCKRTAGTWGTVETVATNSGDTDGVSTHSNLDQAGSIALLSDGRPVITYLSLVGTTDNDNTGDLIKIKIRSANGGTGTWAHDDPTRTSLPGLHTHTHCVHTRGDDIYTFLAHGDAPNIWPGYAVKPAGGSWTGGPTGQVTIPAQSSSIGDTALFDGSAYVSGTRTSKGTVGSQAGTLDGCAISRWDMLRDPDPSVIDVTFWDEDTSGAVGAVFYTMVPTGVSTVGASLVQPATVASPSLSTVGASLVQPATVRTLRTASLLQPAVLRSTIAAGLTQPATIRTLAASSLVQIATVQVIRGSSLTQPATLRTNIAGSLVQVGKVLTLNGASLTQPATIRVAGIVGGSLVQPAALRTFATGSLTQPATVLTLKTGTLTQPALVLTPRSASLIQRATVSTPNLMVGGSLIQRADLRRLAAASLIQRAHLGTLSPYPGHLAPITTGTLAPSTAGHLITAAAGHLEH